MAALNAFHGNKKVVIVNINNNQTAKETEAALKAENFNNVVLLSAPKSYPGYYELAELEPDYTLFVEESNSCKVQLCKVEGWPKERLGKYVSRDLTESQKAKECFEHPLKMLGLDPYLLGPHKIDFEDVEGIPWFYNDKSPMLYLKVPAAAKAAQAIAQAVKAYFKG